MLSLTDEYLHQKWIVLICVALFVHYHLCVALDQLSFMTVSHVFNLFFHKIIYNLFIIAIITVVTITTTILITPLS